MLLNACVIMLIGMVVVFSFLCVMILSMNAMSGILQSESFKKMFPEPVCQQAIPAPRSNSSELEEIATVIAIAKANA